MKRLIDTFFAPPPSYGAVKLGLLAALGFALAAATLKPAFDRDTGIPAMSALQEARGQVASVTAHRYGTRFRLHGRAERFNVPSKVGDVEVTRSALRSAGEQAVAVWFDPNPHTPWFGSEGDHNVWQLAIGGETVRAFSDMQAGWRADNTVARWLFFTFFASGMYFACLAWRARMRRRAPGAWP